MNPTTTLRAIKQCSPCADGWKRGLAALGPDLDAPISLGDIASSNGATDAFWCLRVFDFRDIALRRVVISGAVLPTLRRASARVKDTRVSDCIAVLTRWCAGHDDAAADAAVRATYAAYAAAATYAAAYATYAVRATYAAYAAAATYAAYAAAACADAAAYATYAVRAAEREMQRADIIAAFPPVRLS